MVINHRMFTARIGGGVLLVVARPEHDTEEGVERKRVLGVGFA